MYLEFKIDQCSLMLYLYYQTASEGIENIRTVQSLTREVEFYDKYSSYLSIPYRYTYLLTTLCNHSIPNIASFVFVHF